MCPLGLIWPPLVYGEFTLTTCASPLSPARSRVMAARTAGAVTDPVVWNTTWASSPAWAGNRCPSRRWARDDSVELPPNLLRKIPWNTKLRAVMITNAASQVASTARRRVAHQRPRRPRRLTLDRPTWGSADVVVFITDEF